MPRLLQVMRLLPHLGLQGRHPPLHLQGGMHSCMISQMQTGASCMCPRQLDRQSLHLQGSRDR